MDLSLSPTTRQLIAERMKRGGYESADAVVRAGLATLDQQESLGDFAPGEMTRLLLEGERSGPPVDGEAALADFARRRGEAASGPRA
jgi:putative addiction module CopG family antidote